MSNTALSAGEPDLTSEPRSVPAVAKHATSAPKARAKRARPKKPAAAPAQGAHQITLATSPSTLSSPPKSQVGTLLVGAGIGAAVTLSVVALGSRRGRGSAIAMAVTKSVTYAIARTTENGSLLNVLARAVSSAIA